MKRLTTDNPDTNLDTMLNFAYAKDMKVILRYAGDKENADLCEYVAREADRYGCNMTAEDIMEDGCIDCAGCPLGTLLTVATQAAELRGRLKKIEDILGDDYDLEHLARLLAPPIEGEGKEELPMEEILGYLAALSSAQEAGTPDFDCPICGGNAHWSASPDNGHVTSKCDRCGMLVKE